MFTNVSKFLRSIDPSSEKLFKLSLFSVFLFCLAIILRYPSLIFEPRFWGEERLYYETFLQVNSWWEGFDALQYPAYFTLSRHAAFFSSLVPLKSAPLITTLFGFIMLLLPVIIIFFTDSKYWRTLEQKIILSLFLVFSCSTGEIWLNATNTHFILPITTFLILLDENLKSLTKRLFYFFLIFVGALHGPYSLLISPFFLIRYLRFKEKTVFYYCLILLIFGSIHILWFYASSLVGTGNENRLSSESISEELSIIQRLIYLIQFNVVFAFLGYFASLGFRIIMELVNFGADSSYYITVIQILSLEAENLPSVPLLSLSLIQLAVNTSVFGLLGFAFLKLFRISDSDENINFISLFIYLSVAISFLSIGGHGGFRYSYITSFVFLFFIYHKFFITNGVYFGKNIKTILVMLPILIGVLEFYPRMLSYTPSVLFSSTEKIEWPNWSDEVAKWEKNPEYKPLTWPYLKNKDVIWPERTWTYPVNLNEAETWTLEGKEKFSDVILRIVNGERFEPKENHESTSVEKKI